MIHLVEAFLRYLTYAALMLVLCASGMGVPIPEDIPLIYSGYLCNKEHSPLKEVKVGIDENHDGKYERYETRPHAVPHLYIMMIAGMVGVLGGDSFVFMIGRRGIDSDNFVARHLRKVMHSKRRQKVEHHFAKHGNLTVFVGRFMPGLRSLVFSMAGMSRMSYLRFMLLDGLAAIASVPLFITIGYIFADKLNWLFGKIDRIKHILIPCAIVVVAAGILFYYLRKYRLLRQAADTP